MILKNLFTGCQVLKIWKQDAVCWGSRETSEGPRVHQKYGPLNVVV